MKERYTSLDQLPLTLTVMEVAAVLGISRTSAYDLFHTKGFPSVSVGRRLMVSKESLRAWMNGKTADV